MLTLRLMWDAAMAMFLCIGNSCPYPDWISVAAGSGPRLLDLAAQLFSVLQIPHNVHAFSTQLTKQAYVILMSRRCTA
jgi:hypothetical protein